ncbi:hypothetical protein YC2023_110806 [Brassica napus]
MRRRNEAREVVEKRKQTKWMTARGSYMASDRWSSKYLQLDSAAYEGKLSGDQGDQEAAHGANR